MEDNTLTEFETNLKHYVVRLQTEDGYTWEQLLRDIRQSMPPTCTSNERKFLDEIRKMKYHENNVGTKDKCIVSHDNSVIIWQSKFKNVNLSELVGKKE